MTVPKFGLAPTVFPQPPQIDPDKISEEDPKMLAETVKELLMYIKKLAPYDNALKNNINRNFIASGKRIDNFSVNELEAATGWFKKVFVGRTSQFYFDGDKGTMVVTDTDGNKRLELGLIAANQIGLKVWDSDDNLVFDIDGAVLPTDILRNNDVLRPANLPSNLGYLSGGKWPVSYIPNLSANIFTSGIIATNRLSSSDVINSAIVLSNPSGTSLRRSVGGQVYNTFSRCTVPSLPFRSFSTYSWIMVVTPSGNATSLKISEVPIYPSTRQVDNSSSLVTISGRQRLQVKKFLVGRSSTNSYLYFGTRLVPPTPPVDVISYANPKLVVAFG